MPLGASNQDLFSLGWWIIKVVIMVIILFITLTTMAYETYFERKVMARMQSRLGPNRTGPFGLLQPAADAVKLLIKEDIIPAQADKWVFYFAPIISFFTAVTAVAVAPFGAPGTPLPGTNITIDPFIADINVGLLFILALSSFGVYGIIMAGWASNNKYSLLGGLRSSAQLISYEIIMGISMVGCILFSGTLSLGGMVSWQASWGSGQMWLILLQPVAFITYLTSGIAETNRNPFDLPEAEQELVAGYHTEYSGMRFGLFYLAEYINMLVVAILATSVFLGGWDSPFSWIAALMHVTPGSASFIGFISGASPLWFVGKMAFFIFFYFWLRSTLPRFRYDQLMGLCWKVFLPIVLVNILIAALLKQFSLDAGPGFLWIAVVVELVWAGAVVFGLSRLASGSWFTHSEPPRLASNMPQLIPPGAKVMMGDRTVHMGSGRADTTGVQQRLRIKD
jgi:NADH-quinone oxidoreductase subunit H